MDLSSSSAESIETSQLLKYIGISASLSEQNENKKKAKEIKYLKSNYDTKKLIFKDPEIFQYKLRSQPNEINSGIATSLVFSAWNACTYVGQISDEMVKEKESDQSYIKCIEDIIRDNDGLWFNDELITIERN